MNSTERGLAGGIVVLVVICLIMFVYLVVRAANQVISVLVRYPHASRPLWFALGVFVCASVAAFEWQSEPFMWSAFASGAGVLLVSRWIELVNSEAFQEPVTFASLQDNALHSPWWESNDDRLLQRSAA